MKYRIDEYDSESTKQKPPKVHIPFIQEHASFKAVLFPLLSIMVIYADMTELIKDGNNRRITATQNLQVVVVARCRGHAGLWLRMNSRLSLLWLSSMWMLAIGMMVRNIGVGTITPGRSHCKSRRRCGAVYKT
jgi:hypothetical protein